ncbi:MAG: cupin domain-containing protein [Acetobacteraceae bacterium]|nr:cupin domain-containing protein [Acetobacteraceae bacterium]
MLAATAAGGLAAVAATARAASFGNPDEPPQGAINTQGHPASVSDPGPHNPALQDQFPGAFSPPATNSGDLPMFWASFNNAPRRIQNGGWARQVTQFDFQISEEIAGVNMRLTRGGIRELHWHQAAEWAYVTYGSCRITTIDQSGRANVEDVREGGLWYFPSGMPHSLQGIGDDGCEFIIVFDDGRATEFITLLVTDWIAHTPPEDLALNFGVPAEAFSKIPLHDLYIFQGQLPGPLAADQQQAQGDAGAQPLPSTFQLNEVAPTRQTRGGSVRIADSSNFKASKTIAASAVTIHPGGMREMHWHPNADEWIYIVAGEGQATVFNTGPKVVSQNFRAGDIGYVKRNYGHYIRNTGKNDLVYLEVFRSSYFADVSLSNWLAHTPTALVAQHFNIDSQVIAQFPCDKPLVLPV